MGALTVMLLITFITSKFNFFGIPLLVFTGNTVKAAPLIFTVEVITQTGLIT